MKSDLNIFYLDDGTLGGEADTVLEDLLTIKGAFNTHGLELNPTKCEIFLVNSTNDQNDSNVTHVMNSFEDVCNGIKVIEKQHLSLLGAPSSKWKDTQSCSL